MAAAVSAGTAGLWIARCSGCSGTRHVRRWAAPQLAFTSSKGGGRRRVHASSRQTPGVRSPDPPWGMSASSPSCSHLTLEVREFSFFGGTLGGTAEIVGSAATGFLGYRDRAGHMRPASCRAGCQMASVRGRTIGLDMPVQSRRLPSMPRHWVPGAGRDGIRQGSHVDGVSGRIGVRSRHSLMRHRQLGQYRHSESCSAPFRAFQTAAEQSHGRDIRQGEGVSCWIGRACTHAQDINLFVSLAGRDGLQGCHATWRSRREIVGGLCYNVPAFQGHEESHVRRLCRRSNVGPAKLVRSRLRPSVGLGMPSPAARVRFASHCHNSVTGAVACGA